MPIADLRRVSGMSGPLRAARVVDLEADDFTDPRGFCFSATVAGRYTYRPLEAGADLAADLQPGEGPGLLGVPLAVVAIRRGAGLSALVAYP